MSQEELFEETIVHPTVHPVIDYLENDSSQNLDKHETMTSTLGGACCSASIGELRRLKTKNRDPLEKFQKHIRSEAFKEFVKTSGLEFLQFDEPHLWCKEMSNGKNVPDATFFLPDRRFQEILRNKNIDDTQQVAVVFHGTSTNNIADILQHGLDPARRCAQAYGIGEYFSKDPSICVSYCKTGKAIIVFLVIVPLPSKEPSNKPYDFVIVEDNSHQFPLGVFRFDRVDPSALQR